MHRATLALAAALGLVAGCDPGAGSGSAGSASGGETEGVLARLERFAWVAPGRLPFNPVLGVLRPPALEEALLVDRFEVTRGEWLRFLDAHGDEGFDARAVERWRTWPPHTESWPASWMDLGEAEAFARWAGLRLPTAEEWTWVAVGGPLLLTFPWSRFDYQASVANTLDLRLDPPRPTPVGTFEEGASVDGCYDMYGNVAEWTRLTTPAAAGDAPLQGVIQGGSYLKSSRPTMEFREVLSGAWRAPDIGLRCVAPAEAWLRSALVGLELDSADVERLRAVGRRFGRDAEPTLEALASEPGAPAALEHLLAGARP